MRSRFSLWLGLAGMVLLATQAVAVERRALLIGIDDYSGRGLDNPSPRDRWPASATIPENRWLSLKGAVSDVGDVEALLRSAYRIDHLEVLRNGQATRAGIRDAIARLTASSMPGDEVLFYYAGHGSQILSGSRSEGDGLDETLVPADSALGAADIRDKELRRWFNKLLDRKVRLTIILDSCHSATGVRGDPGWQTPRGIAPVRLSAVEAIDEGSTLESRGAIIISAALDHQQAHERCEGERCFGAFTRALLDSVRMVSRPEDQAVAELVKRTRARLRLHEHMQEPVLTSSPLRRLDSLLGGRVDVREGVVQVAVEEVKGNRLRIQGGWVNGLTVGSELRLPGNDNITARIVKLEGPDLAEAELVVTRALNEGPGGSGQAVVSGTLLELDVWAPPPGEPIRLWLPEGPYEKSLQLARQLARRARAGSFEWVADPSQMSPTHVLDYRSGVWTLSLPDGSQETVFASNAIHKVTSHLNPASRLFVRLPPSDALRQRLLEASGDGLTAAAVLVDDPKEAHYLLAGSLQEGAPRFSWLLRSVLNGPQTLELARAKSADLPVRSMWTVSGSDVQDEKPVGTFDGLIGRLLADARTLGRIHGWMTLESNEQRSKFPYRLAILPSSTDGKELGRGIPADPFSDSSQAVGFLEFGKKYDIVLWNDVAPTAPSSPGYVYVFTIDPQGRSQILYPRGGVAENRFPKFPPGSSVAPAQLILPDAGFETVPPLGRDVYFLFISSQLIHDVGVFEWDPVRGGERERPTNALEQLLEDRTVGTRSSKLEAIPAEWRIERLVFESRRSPSNIETP